MYTFTNNKIVYFLVIFLLVSLSSFGASPQILPLTNTPNGIVKNLVKNSSNSAVFGFEVKVTERTQIIRFTINSSVDLGNYYKTVKLYRSADPVYSVDDTEISTISSGSAALFPNLNEVLQAGESRYFFVVVDVRDRPNWVLDTDIRRFYFSASQGEQIVINNPYWEGHSPANFSGASYTISPEGTDPYTEVKPIVRSIDLSSLNSVTNNNVASTIDLSSSEAAVFGFAIHAVGQYTIDKINIGTTVDMGNYFSRFALYRSENAKFSESAKKIADGINYGSFAHFEGLSESFKNMTPEGQTNYYFLVVTPKKENASWITNDIQFSFNKNQGQASLQQGNTAYNPSSFVGNTYNLVLSTWTGEVSTAWSTDKNWKPVKVPADGATIVIPKTARNPVLDKDRTYNSLKIASGATVNLNGQKLSLRRMLENNGEVLNSGSAANASLIFTGSGNHEISGKSDITLDNLGVHLTSLTDTLFINSPVALKGLASLKAGVLQANGNLLLKSTKDQDGAIGELYKDLSDITGEIKVERYISSSDPSYRLIGSPVYTKESNGKYYFSYKQYAKDMYLSGSASSKNYPYTFVNSLYVYNESLTGIQGLLAVSNLEAEYEIGSGAYLRAFGSKAEGDFNKMGIEAYKNKTVFDAYIAVVSGQVFKGDLIIPVKATNTGKDETAKYNDGFNLVSNPYPSPIDWKEVTKGKDVNQTIYIYDVKNKGFLAYDNKNNQIPGGNIIRSGQAFFVKVKRNNSTLNSVVNTSITFTESSKLSVPTGAGTKPLRMASTKVMSTHAQTTALMSNHKQLIRLSLSNSDGLKDYMAVSFNEGEQGFDDTDDVKFGEGSIAIAALVDGSMKLSIAKEGDVTKPTAIPLYIKAASSGTMSIESLEAPDFPLGTGIYLEDKYNGAYIDLAAYPVYEFTVDLKQPATFGSNRLVIHAVPPTTLPVILASFEAKKATQGIHLNWKTEVEKDMATFVVERSSDAHNFEVVGQIKAAGRANSYTITDKYPLSGVAYYRLAMYDQDGSVSYSAIKDVRFDLADYSITVYPNPVVSQLQIKHPAAQHGVMEVSLLNTQGSVIHTQTWLANEGVISMDVQSYPSGLYLLKVYDPANPEGTVMKKILKN